MGICHHINIRFHQVFETKTLTATTRQHYRQQKQQQQERWNSKILVQLTSLVTSTTSQTYQSLKTAAKIAHLCAV